MDKYEDIINMRHPISTKHKQMSKELRASIFAPFAALTGYDDELKEQERIVNSKIELTNENKLLINENLINIKNNIKDNPKVEITYFVKDNKKSGGKYITIIDNVKRIDEVNKYLYLFNYKINIDDIIKIEFKF